MPWSWPSLSVLTSSEVASITNMLPLALAAAGNVSPCVAGTLYRCTSSSSQTMTLPAPAAGTTIGFLVDTATPTGVTIVQHAAESILSPRQPTRTTGSILLSSPDQYIVLQADGTNWHEIASGGLDPLGILGYAEVTASQGSIGALTDLTGLSVAVTVLQGRRLRITGYCWAFTGGSADSYDMFISEGGSQLAAARVTNPGGAGLFVAPSKILLPTAGAHTYKLQAQHASGATAGVLAADATHPAYILVEDIGAK